MKKLILISILLCIKYSLLGQDEPPEALPKILKASPTVSSLMRFEEVPIDFYTGQPDISIPLFKKEINEILFVELRLKYSSMGVRIDERSGWAGTGWSLEAGGAISRTVRGIPDERDDVLALGVLNNPDFWNYNTLSNEDKERFRWNTMGTSLEKYDSELDLYQFTYPGGSGRFVLVKDGGLKAKILSSNQDISISIVESTDPNLQYHIDEFTITDANGIRYRFAQFEFTSSLSYSTYTSHVSGSDPGISDPGAAGMAHFRSAWMLTDISLSNGNSLASITYQTKGETYTSSESFTETEIISGLAATAFHVSYNNGVLKPKRNVSYYDVSISGLYPETITFNDDTKYDFVISGNHPETGGAIISEIRLLDNNNVPVKRVSFDTETLNSRLWLNSIKEVAHSGDAQDKLYVFTYRDKGGLPVFGSHSDPWGYYNASNVNDDVTNPNVVTTGLLTSVKFPTGGTKEFVWESNTFSHGAGSDLTEEKILENPDNVTNHTEGLIFSGSYDLGNLNGLIYSQPASISYDQDITIDVYDLTISEQNLEDDVIIRFEGPSNTVNIPLHNQSQVIAQVPAGLYTVKVMIPGDLDIYTITGDIRIRHKSKRSPLNWYLYGGGSRIKEVLFKDGSDTKRRFTYDYSDLSDPTRSSGAVDGLLGSLARRYNMSTSKMIKISSDASTVTDATIHYEVFEKGTNAELTKGGYVGYQSVKVREEGNGYTIYHYDSPKQNSNSSQVFTFPFRPAANLDHLRGLLRKKEVYNELDQLLIEETTDYSSVAVPLAESIKVVDVESCDQVQFYDRYQDYQNGNVTKNIPSPGYPGTNCGLGGTGHNAYVYSLEYTKSDPSSKIITQFEEGETIGNVVEETYIYTSNNYRVRKSTQKIVEGGEEIIYATDYYYPEDVNLPSGYVKESAEVSMVAVNKKNPPLLVVTNRISGSFPQIVEPVSVVRNKYFEASPNLFQIKQVEVAYGDNPLESRVTFHQYDDYGNILDLSKTGDMRTVYLWGYGKTVPVAEIKNTDYTTVSGILSVDEWEIINNPNATNSQIDIKLETIRDHSSMNDALITTLLYESGKGVESITDANKQKTTYEYDDYGRLLKILDKDDNILQRYTYNFGTEE